MKGWRHNPTSLSYRFESTTITHPDYTTDKNIFDVPVTTPIHYQYYISNPVTLTFESQNPLSMALSRSIWRCDSFTA